MVRITIREKINQTITDGISIEQNELLGVYLSGVPLLIWFYFFALGEVLSNIALNYGLETQRIYMLFLGTIIVASIASGKLIDKGIGSFDLTRYSLGACGAVPLIAFFISTAVQLNIYVLIVGVVTGAGFTALRTYLSDVTEVDERGRIAGGLLLSSLISVAIIKILFTDAPVEASTLFVSLICLGAFFGLYQISIDDRLPHKKGLENNTIRSFIISWILFSTAFGLWNANVSPHPLSLISDMESFTLDIVNLLILASAAFLGGILADRIGRKPVIGLSLAFLASSYLIYALLPFLIAPALLLEVGSWGVLSLVFIFVLWGDLSKKSRGLYYGLSLGILLGGFLAGELIAESFGPIKTAYVAYTSALLIFAALVPLYYSEEPLPKEKIRLREMSGYIRDIKNLKI